MPVDGIIRARGAGRGARGAGRGRAVAGGASTPVRRADAGYRHHADDIPQTARNQASRPRAAVRGTITDVTSSGLTHACARCGAPVPLDVGLCERCNPLGLRDVSSSQVHGIAIAGVIAFIVVMAIVGRFLLNGIGPFTATVADVAPDGAALAITLTVTNEGSSAGQTTCHVTDPMARSSGMGGFLLSPKVEAGGTITFTQTVKGLGSAVRPLEVDCASP